MEDLFGGVASPAESHEGYEVPDISDEEVAGENGVEENERNGADDQEQEDEDDEDDEEEAEEEVEEEAEEEPEEVEEEEPEEESDEEEDEDVEAEMEREGEDDEEGEESADEASDEDEDAEGDEEVDQEAAQANGVYDDAEDGSDDGSDEDSENVLHEHASTSYRTASPERARRALFTTPPVPPKSYTIEPIVVHPHPVATHCLASSLCMTHLLTGSEDGFIRDYDFFAGCNGQSLLTNMQKQHCGLGESVSKGGVLRSWWQNNSDDPDEGPVPVHSMLCQADALWGVSGTPNGHINLFTIRHDPGRIHHVFRGHSGPVSCMAMGADETKFYSGSWDGQAHEYDLNTGQLVRTFSQYGAQMTSIGVRPLAGTGSGPNQDYLFEVPPTPESGERHAPNGFADLNGINETNGHVDPFVTAEGDSGAMPYINGSNGTGMTNGVAPATEGSLQSVFQTAPAEDPPEGSDVYDPLFDDEPESVADLNVQLASDVMKPTVNGILHTPPATAPPVVSSVNSHAERRPQAQQDDEEEFDLPLDSHWPSRPANATSGFTHAPVSRLPVVGSTAFPTFSQDLLMTTSIDGQVLLWDRRVNSQAGSIGRLEMADRTPPWCVSACWSSSGQEIYAGRRNATVDMWDFRVLGRRFNESPRVLSTLRNPLSSGSVSCVAAFPDGAHLVCASEDNIRLWNLHSSRQVDSNAYARSTRTTAPFKIIAGHHGGIVSQILIDATSRFMVTASGNRGWFGETTKTVIVHEMTPIT